MGRHSLVLLALPLMLAVPAPASASTEDSPPTGPQVVRVGAYVVNASDVDLHANSFFADFYLWFLWNGEIDPTMSYEFTNTIAKDVSAVPAFTDADGTPRPDVLPDGRKYQQFHVQGRFLQSFRLDDYPFDEQDLVISMEDIRYDAAALEYVFDSHGSERRADLEIAGWKASPLQGDVTLNRYDSDFGDPRVSGKGYTYSRLDLVMHVEHPGLGLAFDKLFPVALVILITLGCLIVQPELLEWRLTFAVPAFVAVVALQLTTSTALPPTTAILLLDKVYLLAYVVIVLVMVVSIAANAVLRDGRKVAARRIDKLSAAGLSALFFGGTSVMVLLG